MNCNDVERFIEYYSRFYLDSSNSKIDEKDFDDACLPKDLNRTNPDVEAHITQKITEGIFDAESFAWKAGKAGWKDGEFEYVKPLPDKWINGSGGQIKEKKDSQAFTGKDFDDYVKNHEIPITDLQLDEPAGRKELFLRIKGKYDLYNYGTVYIINHMFFLSKGAVPIYDRFAHVAVKALFMHKPPLEVFVPAAPLKDDHPKGKGETKDHYYSAVNTLEEYMWLLRAVFPKEIQKKGDTMFISRKLDQALWVYGHTMGTKAFV